MFGSGSYGTQQYGQGNLSTAAVITRKILRAMARAITHISVSMRITRKH